MPVQTLVRRNFYRDSVTLMRLAAELESMAGIQAVSAIMASPANLDLLAESGMAVDPGEVGPNDLLVAVEGGDPGLLKAALDRAAASFEQVVAHDALPGEDETPRRPRSLAEAKAGAPGARLALISCPGPYAAAEAEKALRLGLDAMIFSDNVALEEEVALKAMAARAGRLVMGPDCGTAILGGIPLGFANKVRRGKVGLIAASGTGLQQVTCLIDRLGGGVSQAIGVGGRDLSGEVGGATTLRALSMLADDAGTETIVIVSKPPEPAVMEKVLAAAGGTGKPVIANFIAADPPDGAPSNVHFATTLEDAASLAIGQALPDDAPNIATLAPGRRRLVGLFSGGTFCYEAQAIAAPEVGRILSNTPLSEADACSGTLEDGHTMLDLGDDAYTSGRPHPMIDFAVRLEMIAQAAADPRTCVILLDIVLGTGAHPDPAAALAPAIADASGPVFVGSVCGTDRDAQGLARQERALADAGMILLPSNARAARHAASLIKSATA